MNKINDEWKSWIWLNIHNGSNKEEIFERLIKAQIPIVEIVKEMDYLPDAVSKFVLEKYSFPPPNLPKIAAQSQRLLDVIQRNNFSLLDNRIQLYSKEEFLDRKMCQALMEFADQNVQRSTVVDKDKPITDTRTSNSSFISATSKEGIEADIFELLLTYFNLEKSETEVPQIQTYEPGGKEYRPHMDSFCKNNRTVFEEQVIKKRNGNRTWSVIIYLNDVEDGGGATQFSNLEISVKPKQGSIIIWNNLLLTGELNESTLHAGLPTKNESKYIITWWLREG